jgi:hypothetical protein
MPGQRVSKPPAEALCHGPTVAEDPTSWCVAVTRSERQSYSRSIPQSVVHDSRLGNEGTQRTLPHTPPAAAAWVMAPQPSPREAQGELVSLASELKTTFSSNPEQKKVARIMIHKRAQERSRGPQAHVPPDATTSPLIGFTATSRMSSVCRAWHRDALTCAVPPPPMRASEVTTRLLPVATRTEAPSGMTATSRMG